MANIVLAAYGSRGDILPLTDFGCRLRDAGHDVLCTAPPDLVDDLAACGLRALPVDVELEGDLETDGPMKLAGQLLRPKGMRQLGDNLLTALADVPVDVLLLSPFAELAGHPLAEARGVPSIGVRLQPISTTAEFAPALIGGWTAGPMLNRAGGRTAASMFDRIYGSTVAAFRDRLGLPARSAGALRRDRTAAGWPILHGFSPSVLPRPADWRDGLTVTGYWWPQRPVGWSPPAELVAFLGSGPAPVFVGLGSLMLPRAEAARLATRIHDALRAAGVRGIVQSGGAGLEIEGDDDVLTIGTVPHDWLFPQVAATVHSCGAGTMAAGLRAGKPAVAVPSPGGDQPFWARRLTGLGVAPPALPRPKLTADRLAKAIDAALTDREYGRNAAELAARIGGEDGAAAVVRAVEQLVRC